MTTIREPKWIATSKTFWGLLLMAVPAVAKLAGWQFTGEDTASLQAFFDSAMTLVGMGLGLWGRFTAKAGVTVLP